MIPSLVSGTLKANYPDQVISVTLNGKSKAIPRRSLRS
jgi:hypothetical protein